MKLPHILVSDKSKTKLIIYNKKYKEIECVFNYDVNTAKTDDDANKCSQVLKYILVVFLVILVINRVFYLAIG